MAWSRRVALAENRAEQQHWQDNANDQEQESRCCQLEAIPVKQRAERGVTPNSGAKARVRSG